MLGIRIFCWAYALFILAGRIANYNDGSKGATAVRIVDNVMIIVLLIMLFIAYNF